MGNEIVIAHPSMIKMMYMPSGTRNPFFTVGNTYEIHTNDRPIGNNGFPVVGVDLRRDFIQVGVLLDQRTDEPFVRIPRSLILPYHRYVLHNDLIGPRKKLGSDLMAGGVDTFDVLSITARDDDADRPPTMEECTEQYEFLLEEFKVSEHHLNRAYNSIITRLPSSISSKIGGVR